MKYIPQKACNFPSRKGFWFVPLCQSLKWIAGEPFSHILFCCIFFAAYTSILNVTLSTDIFE